MLVLFLIVNLELFFIVDVEFWNYEMIYLLLLDVVDCGGKLVL